MNYNYQNLGNRMQNNQNIFYSNNFNHNLQNIQPQENLYDTNLNNMLNILSLINFPVIVPYHNEHPLVNCFTPDRMKIFKHWICDICNSSYTFNAPSFYCTACDFDLCQKCFLGLRASQIVIYNYSTGTLCQLNQKFNNYKKLNEKIHNHPMIKIIRERTHFTIDLKCNHCFKDFQRNDEFYYCSLCNYCVCNTCYNKR